MRGAETSALWNHVVAGHPRITDHEGARSCGCNTRHPSFLEAWRGGQHNAQLRRPDSQRVLLSTCGYASTWSTGSNVCPIWCRCGNSALCGGVHMILSTSHMQVVSWLGQAFTPNRLRLQQWSADRKRSKDTQRCSAMLPRSRSIHDC